MGSWLVREAALVVGVVVAVVVGVRVLFKAELVEAIAVAVAFLVVLVTVSLVQWRNAAKDEWGSGGAAPQFTGQYSSDQSANSSGHVQQHLLDSGQQLGDPFPGDLVLAADTGVTQRRKALDLT